MDIQNAIQDYLLSCLADGMSQTTITWRRSQLGIFAKKFSNAMEDITTRQIREYLAAMRAQTIRYKDAPQKPPQEGGYSKESINTHIRCLHTFWRWCAREYGIPNPMERIRYPQPQASTVKAIDPHDFIRLLEATGENTAGIRDRAMLCFLADTGCRLGGLISLTLDQLNLQGQCALVTEKGNRSRMVYFTTFTQLTLERWLSVRQSPHQTLFVSMNDSTPLTASGVNQLLKRLKKRAGIKGRVNPHSFRHNFARQYLQSGGDIATLAKLLGHSNVNTTAAIYAVFTSGELSEFHHKFSPLSGFRTR